MTDEPDTEETAPAASPATTRASANPPTSAQLDVWIEQNKRLHRRSRASVVLIAVAFAIAVGSATSNLLVLNKLDERGVANREVILGIKQGVDNTQKLLDFTGRLESPEARVENDRKTQELLDALTQRVDCNTRLALLDAVVDVFGQDAADSYAEKISEQCTERPTGTAPTGTTATPSSTPPSGASSEATTTTAPAVLVPNG